MCALEAEEGHAVARDDTRIFYRVSGKGPFALVMPVNWGADSYVYTKGLASLEFYLALVTFDPRGVGRSDPAYSEDEFAMEVTARDGAAVADALAMSRTVVIGHSSGGAVALTYALQYPQRVSHLILISTAPRHKCGAQDSDSSRYPATEEGMRASFRASVPLAVRHPSRFQRAIDELAPKMRFSPARLRWTGEAGFDRYDVRGRLGEIRVPTLILHGREDRIVPLAGAEELRKSIADSRLIVFDECGHWPFVERRSEFLAAVKDFLGLEEVSSGPRRARAAGSP